MAILINTESEQQVKLIYYGLSIIYCNCMYRSDVTAGICFGRKIPQNIIEFKMSKMDQGRAL